MTLGNFLRFSLCWHLQDNPREQSEEQQRKGCVLFPGKWEQNEVPPNPNKQVHETAHFDCAAEREKYTYIIFSVRQRLKCHGSTHVALYTRK